MKKISIKGVIIPNDYQRFYDYIKMDATSPAIVSKAIEEAEGEELEVEINSCGGSVFSGSEIYTALKNCMQDVTVKVVGIAASAASVIAMAGKKVMLSPTSQLMIHGASTYAGGDHNIMRHTADVLLNTNKTIANAYRLKTGLSEEEVLKMMDEETFMSPQKAVELKFADEIIFDEGILVNSMHTLLKEETINRIKEIMECENNRKKEAIEARFKLLKMKEVR